MKLEATALPRINLETKRSILKRAFEKETNHNAQAQMLRDLEAEHALGTTQRIEASRRGANRIVEELKAKRVIANVARRWVLQIRLRKLISNQGAFIAPY